MFEQPINDAIQRISRDVLEDRTLIPLAEISADERIDRRLTAFFENEVHWWIYSEATARRRDRRFDYDDPELASLLDYMESVQTRHARFDRSAFLRTLESGVKLGYNFRCRPQTTLKWFVFRGEPTKPLGETLLRMDAFVDYPYFATVFRQWVERKRSERPVFDSISSREFERIIRRIDDQILLSCTIEELLELMDPLFDLAEEAGGQKGELPIEVLIVYFDDKKISKLVEFLESIAADHPHMTRESFATVIEKLLVAVEDEPEADFSSVYQEDVLDAVVRDHLAGPVGEEGPESGQQESPVDPSEEAVDDVDRDERPPTTERASENDTSAIEPSLDDSTDTVDATDVDTSDENGSASGRKKDAKRKKKTSARSLPEGLDDIRSKIDEGLEKKILKKIFGRDRDSYEGCLTDINDASSWREASALLDRLFDEREVDPYSKTAIRFTDAVYGRYLDRHLSPEVG